MAQRKYDISLGRKEPCEVEVASVRFGGKWSCSWCSAFHYGDQPARVFALLDLVVNT